MFVNEIKRTATSQYYTLLDVALNLGIDTKTLKKRMQMLGIEPQLDVADRRRRVISAEQMRQMQLAFAPSLGLSKIEGYLDARLSQEIDPLKEQISALSAQIALLRTELDNTRARLLTIQRRLEDSERQFDQRENILDLRRRVDQLTNQLVELQNKQRAMHESKTENESVSPIWQQEIQREMIMLRRRLENLSLRQGEIEDLAIRPIEKEMLKDVQARIKMLQRRLADMMETKQIEQLPLSAHLLEQKIAQIPRTPGDLTSADTDTAIAKGSNKNRDK